jgi:hypothetical protein
VTESHDFGALGDALSDSIGKIITSLVDAFTPACSDSGFLRNSYIEVTNNLTTNIFFDARYLDSGQDYSNGRSPIIPRSTQKWTFTKKGGSATGANGLISFFYNN